MLLSLVKSAKQNYQLNCNYEQEQFVVLKTNKKTLQMYIKTEQKYIKILRTYIETSYIY